MAKVCKRRGKFVVDFRDQTGRRRWETYDTRKQADDALAERIAEVKGGVYRAARDLPTFATVADTWLTGMKDRAATTVAFYTRQLEGHLVPAFGEKRIDRITTEDVERFRNEKRDTGLEPATINSMMQRLTTILRYAVKHQYITRNPAEHTLVERVKAPRIADRLPDAIDPSEVLSAEQAGALIAHSEVGIHRTFLTTALLTGARSGELLALTWGHVDLVGRKLRIGRSLSWDRTGDRSRPVFGAPKTDSSYRTLDLAPELVAVLSEWKLRTRFKADADLVFTNQTGGALHLSWLFKGARRAFTAAELEPINLHGLRHTAASIWISQRRPVTQVAKLLGHKDPSITIRVYSHWFADAEEKNREAMGDLAGAIFSAGSKTVAAAAS